MALRCSQCGCYLAVCSCSILDRPMHRAAEEWDDLRRWTLANEEQSEGRLHRASETQVKNDK